MNKLFEKLVEISEKSSRAGLLALQKVYRAHAKKLEPEESDVIDALWLLEDYYQDYLDWYDKYKRKAEELPKEHKKLYDDYKKRFQEIRSSIKSKNLQKMIIALDNGINQWHQDYPVLYHLQVEADEDEYEDNEDLHDIIDDIGNVLKSLGRWPEKSPYIFESTVDYPREDLDSGIWDKDDENGYRLKPEVKKIILNTLKKYTRVDLIGIADEIHITGSIGTNQYTDDADVDVHIVVDASKLRDAEVIQKEVFKFFRKEITFIDYHNIEVFLQFNPQQELLAEAVYNLLEDTWIKGPKIVPKSYDPYEDFSDVLDDIKAQAVEADEELGELRRDMIDYDTVDTAIKHLSGDAKQKLLSKLKNKLFEIEDDIEKLKKLKLSWIQLRRNSSIPVSEEEALEDVAVAKKWREANAIFKFLSRYKYMKVISKLEQLLDDKKLDSDDINIIRQMMGTENK